MGAALTLLFLGAAIPAPAWGGKVRLKHRYHTGRKMVYTTTMHTKTEIHADPPGLQNFLPPVPTNFTMQQQSTVTVKATHSDGGADIQYHFDKFEFQSDLPERVPADLRDPIVLAQKEVSEQMAGQEIDAHYDRNGLLTGFEGGMSSFDQLDLPLRESFRQTLGFFLQQMGGETLYPEHPVKPGETWARKFDSQPNPAYPYHIEGQNTLRYVGKAKVKGAKAAVVEFSFVNVLTPAPGAIGKADPLAQLQSTGVDLRIEGQGKGRVLLALDDGRVLQDHVNVHQTLRAHLKNSARLPFTGSEAAKLEMQSDTEMDVEGSGR
jgi:hypothetical protein